MPYRARIPKNSPVEYKFEITEGNAHKHVALALARFRREPVPEFEGTGCVMAAGGKAYLRMAYITVSRIRQQGWTWPIQIWHLGPNELPDNLKIRFAHLDVKFVDAFQVRRKYPARQLGGWSLKSYMVAHCPWDNVLQLDADCVPVQDPMRLFDSSQFRDTGIIVAPDIRPNRPSDLIFALMGVRMPENFTEGESGFTMVNKTRRWREWQLVRWFNDFSDFFYRYVLGDKDGPILACLRTGVPFSTLPACEWKKWGILHFDFEGKPLAEHHLDRKRNPKAEVPLEHLRLWKQFEDWGMSSSCSPFDVQSQIECRPSQPHAV